MNFRNWSLVIGTTLLASGCSQTANTAVTPHLKVRAEDPIQLSPEEIQRLGIVTNSAQLKTIPENLETAGVVKGDTTMTMPVLSLVPGRAEEVDVQIGDQVQTGQKLATVRSDEVAQIESELLQKLLDLESDEMQLKVKLTLAQKIYNRKQLLLQEKIASQADVEGAESDLQEAEAALKSSEIKRRGYIETAKQRLKLFGVLPSAVDKIAKTKTIDHLFQVRAPRSGMITERDIDPGEAVENTKSMFTISDLHNVWVVAQVFERNLEQVKVGTPAEVSIQGAPNTKFYGQINFIDSHVDPETRTVSVRATITNSSLKLKPDMFAKLNLTIGKISGLFVPEQAVQKLGESEIVYIKIAPNTFREQKVTLGARFNGNAQVLQGLKQGDEVVTNGSVRLLGKVVQRINS
ncbi:MAG: efflux RND transporter periplasmic adaptor subunit [Cyanobacteria bacterium SZAS-4]|nr:efflux RND transporter periplasmic adaptor subunit [Cyanobacteria bacterium SZAS-4]